MEYNLDKFKNTLSKWKIELDQRQINQFLLYFEMLVEKNKVMNLTAITEFDQVIEKHFLDSILLGNFLNLNQSLKVMDMGTGAGFPGIPLKIAFPELKITLADSLNKRVLFLQEVIDELKLDKIEAVHGRAEDLANNMIYREKYDLCVSRAVANLATLSEYCLPFITISGKFVSYKSGDIQEELKKAEKAVFLLGGKMIDVQKYIFGDNDLHRSFVVIEKIKKTPKNYPRKAGTPSKQPI